MTHRADSPHPHRASNRIHKDWLLAQIRANLYLGKLAPGDRLPSVRELARQLGISPTTALDLYHTLEADGLVQGRERSGVFLGHPGCITDRSARERSTFGLVATVARKMALRGIPEAEFTNMLRRYTGAERRDDFEVGFVGYQESLELVDQQLTTRLGFRLQLVHIAPRRTVSELRAEVEKHPAIGCLMTTFLMFHAVRELTGQLGLPLVTVRLSPAAARIFEMPASSRRYVVVRDHDTAVALRRTMCNLARIRGDLPPCAAGAEDGACRWCDMPIARQAPGVAFAALSEDTLLPEFDSDAEIIHATPTALGPARARWGSVKRIVPFGAEMSDDTLDELLFHYVCGRTRSGRSSDCVPTIPLGSAPSARPATAVRGAGSLPIGGGRSGPRPVTASWSSAVNAASPPSPRHLRAVSSRRK